MTETPLRGVTDNLTSGCGNPKPEKNCRYAEHAADMAVRKVFAVLGVNIDEPKEVREFQDDLRFGAAMRKAVNKGVLAAVGAIAAGVCAAVWYGIQAMLNK